MLNYSNTIILAFPIFSIFFLMWNFVSIYKIIREYIFLSFFKMHNRNLQNFVEQLILSIYYKIYHKTLKTNFRHIHVLNIMVNIVYGGWYGT